MGRFQTDGSNANVSLDAGSHNINIQGNLTVSGNLDMTTSAGAITLDTLGPTNVTAQNITLTAPIVNVQNAGTVIAAIGTQTSAVDVYTDNLPNATTYNFIGGSGGAGSILINGSLQNNGTLNADGSGTTVDVHYTLSNLDLSNDTFNFNPRHARKHHCHRYNQREWNAPEFGKRLQHH